MLSGRLKDKKIRSRSQQVKFFVQGHIKVRDRAEVRLQRSCPPQAALGGAWPWENVEHQRTQRTSSESRAHTRTRQAFPHIRRLQELPASPKKQASPVPPIPELSLCHLTGSLSSSHSRAGHVRSLRQLPFLSPLLRVAKDMSPQGRPLDPKASQVADAKENLLAGSPRTHGALVTTPGAESSSELDGKALASGSMGFPEGGGRSSRGSERWHFLQEVL